MKKLIKAGLLLGLMFLMAQNAWATNITISDGNYDSSSWNGDYEDNEVEPGMVGTQAWDLEAFVFDGSLLYLIGGYDFINGQYDYYSKLTIMSGDIFFDFGGDAEYGDIDGTGNGYTYVQDTFGYDMVFDMNWVTTTDSNGNITGTFNAYTLNTGSQVTMPYYSVNYGSGPWQYDPSTSNNSSNDSVGYGTFGYTTYTGDYLGLTGGNHNVVTIDLASVFTTEQLNNFLVTFTMGCGNDNIVGQGSIPNPEPATMILFGIGLLGIAGLGRRKKINK